LKTVSSAAPAEIALTDIGGDVARRAERVLASTRDVIDGGIEGLQLMDNGVELPGGIGRSPTAM
jgi:hypothetical protein